MFAQVRLLNGFHESLWYEVPHELKELTVGMIVSVPLRARVLPALIQKISSTRPNVSWQLRSIEGIEKVPEDVHYQKFINQLADYYQLSPLYFAQRLRSFLTQKEHEIELAVANSNLPEAKIVTLTDEQEYAVNQVTKKIDGQSYSPFLLHGLTGSGKTEVYKKALQHAINNKKSALVLLPEVSLAVQFTQLFRVAMPECTIFGFHSAVGIKEKRALWQALVQGAPLIIIGVHLPVMLPIKNLGIIVVDEEHEVGYQEKKHPRINSKEAALVRAQTACIPIILGSATPSISSLYAVQQKGWQLLELKNRYAGSLPRIEVVQFDKNKKRPNFWVSKELFNAITDRLLKKEQTILFLNRRGHSFFVQCTKCGEIERCTHCSVTLTLHDHEQLLCHYCGLKKQMPPACVGCGADKTSFLKKGIGTQQLVSVIQSLFPSAHIERADVDATVNKKKWQQTLKSFHDGAIDILIGTQTITKGYHFPKVTLVGVIWADLNLHFPMFNAAETTLQQLIQVAGRAGRASHDSLVIVQTMSEHPIFSFLNETDYIKFYETEMITRQEIEYPPYARFVEIELKHTDEAIVEREAQQLVQQLNAKSQSTSLAVRVLGPARPLVHKVNNLCSRKMYCKASTMLAIQRLFQSIDENSYQSSIYFTPHPLS
ncbi:primosomal protein N' [Candidatus Dependentiae bacterium]|nr:primosomal protein N' [Candidatus Dependentiae bacterium]